MMLCFSVMLYNILFVYVYQNVNKDLSIGLNVVNHAEGEDVQELQGKQEETTVLEHSRSQDGATQNRAQVSQYIAKRHKYFTFKIQFKNSNL